MDFCGALKTRAWLGLHGLTFWWELWFPFYFAPSRLPFPLCLPALLRYLSSLLPLPPNLPTSAVSTGDPDPNRNTRGGELHLRIRRPGTLEGAAQIPGRDWSRGCSIGCRGGTRGQRLQGLLLGVVGVVRKLYKICARNFSFCLIYTSLMSLAK